MTFEPQPEYDTTLQTALAGGNPPDFFYVDSLRLPDLAEAGALVPAPEGSITEPDDIYPSLVEAFTYDGTWYCPPKDFSTLGLVYDAECPRGGRHRAADDDGGVGCGRRSADHRRPSSASRSARAPSTAGVFMLANGGYIVDDEVSEMTLDSEENRSALQYLADLFANDYAANPAALEAGWPGEAFGQGKAAMVIEGNWIVGFLAENFPDRNWAVAEVPEGNAGRGNVRLHGLLRRRRRVVEPGRCLAGHRLPHRTRGCGGVDRRIQRDAGARSRCAKAGSLTIPSSSRS